MRAGDALIGTRWVIDAYGGDPSVVSGGCGGPVQPWTPDTEGPPTPTCDTGEIAYITSYLSRRGSPLAPYAVEIVALADAYGVDDRFIVALAGVESIYGKTQQNSPTWGYYNAFSN